MTRGIVYSSICWLTLLTFLALIAGEWCRYTDIKYEEAILRQQRAEKAYVSMAARLAQQNQWINENMSKPITSVVTNGNCSSIITGSAGNIAISGCGGKP